MHRGLVQPARYSLHGLTHRHNKRLGHWLRIHPFTRGGHLALQAADHVLKQDGQETRVFVSTATNGCSFRVLDGGVLGGLEAVVRGGTKEVTEVMRGLSEGESDCLHEAVGEGLELVHEFEDMGLEGREEGKGRGGPLVGTLQALVVGRLCGHKRGQGRLFWTELELFAVVDLVVCELFAW